MSFILATLRNCSQWVDIFPSRQDCLFLYVFLFLFRSMMLEAVHYLLHIHIFDNWTLTPFLLLWLRTVICIKKLYDWLFWKQLFTTDNNYPWRWWHSYYYYWRSSSKNERNDANHWLIPREWGIVAFCFTCDERPGMCMFAFYSDSMRKFGIVTKILYLFHWNQNSDKGWLFKNTMMRSWFMLSSAYEVLNQLMWFISK